MFYHSQLSKGNQVKMLYFHAAATGVFKGIDSITEDTEGNNLDDGSVPAGNSVYVNGNASITLQVTDISEETTVTIANRWTTLVTVTYKGTDYTLAAGATQALTVAVDDIITVAEGTAGSTFREWRNSTIPFVKGAACRITAMPAMDAFTTTAAGTTAGNYFFYFFNNNGSLTSLPDGSFNTSKITSVGNYFFSYFNYNGKLTSLPDGSFNTSNITSVGASFFSGFDYNGSLTSLPASFALPAAPTSVGIYYCTNMFNGSDLTKGNGAKMLYFHADATDAFTGTGITSADPAAGDSVWVNMGPNVITLEVTDATKNTVTITNKWKTPVIVTHKGKNDTIIAGGKTDALPVAVGDIITVAEDTENETFRTWYGINNTSPLVNGAACRITDMPAMDAFTTDAAGTTAGANFFAYFNSKGFQLQRIAYFTTGGLVQYVEYYECRK